MKIKADLHNHLRTSSIFRDEDFNKTIDIIYKKLGDRTILGMINFGDNRYEKFSGLKGYDRQNLGNALYIPEKGILIIKGEEVPTEQGHLLVLGLNRDIHLKPNRPLEDTLKEARDNNGILIADHPFFIESIGLYLKQKPKIIESLDGIEVHNGGVWLPIPRYLNANKKAQEFYNEITNDYDIGAVSFSDGHSLYDIGSSYTILDLEKIAANNSEELNNSLRKSIKEHKDFSEDKKTNSIFGALNHATKMSIIRVLGL